MKDKLREELFKIVRGIILDKLSAGYLYETIDNDFLPAMQRFMPDVEELFKLACKGNDLMEVAELVEKRLEVVPEQVEKKPMTNQQQNPTNILEISQQEPEQGGEQCEKQ